MMKRCSYLLLGLLALWGCIRNDLDYPTIIGNILSFEVEGARRVIIDTDAREVVVELEESADPSAVVFKSMEITPEASCEALPGVLDLRKPIELLLTTYQEYRWKISATQPVERYVRCRNQMREASFNPEEKSVFVYVPDNQPLSKLVIEDMKLELEGSEIVSTTGYRASLDAVEKITEPVSFPMTLDCVMERSFEVKVKGGTVVWTMKAFQLEVNTLVSDIDAHCYSARVRGMFSSGETPDVQYHKVGDSEWISVEDESVNGVGVTALISSLEEDTEYVCRIVDGESLSPEVTFRTLRPVQPENMGFDDWYQSGKVWYPFPQGGPKVWDSANEATASFSGSATTPDDSFSIKGRSVKLVSSYAVVKFASGSIFMGSYVGLHGMGAKLDWGIPFGSKPASLSGHIAYSPAPINYVEPPYQGLKGQNDTGHIQIILADWDEPFRVDSTDKKYLDCENDPGIIGYGRYSLSEATDGFIPFTMDVEYRNSRIPKWLVIVAAYSSLGDYFTGGEGSTLWLDELVLNYD
ncbi:MAG: PCMD domain-containing protein [Bacteroidales bacterium]|nr:PCMD domain-containing protein [Bacteroidales bacterium]